MQIPVRVEVIASHRGVSRVSLLNTSTLSQQQARKSSKYFGTKHSGFT